MLTRLRSSPKHPAVTPWHDVFHAQCKVEVVMCWRCPETSTNRNGMQYQAIHCNVVQIVAMALAMPWDASMQNVVFKCIPGFRVDLGRGTSVALLLAFVACGTQNLAPIPYLFLGGQVLLGSPASPNPGQGDSAPSQCGGRAPRDQVLVRLSWC